MREGLSRRRGLAVAAPAMVLAAMVALQAQDRVDYLNGLAYIFPGTQGSADQLLTNGGAGDLSWADPPSPEGLWSGGIVLSTVACPAEGWTRVSAADDRLLRGATSMGGTGGSDTHDHTLTGVLAAAAVSITGSTAGSSGSISGSTSTASVSHSHGSGSSSFYAGATMQVEALTSFSVNGADPSHSHGSGSLSEVSHSHGNGTLAGGSHGHSVGTLAIATASSLAAYYELIICQKD